MSFEHTLVTCRYNCLERERGGVVVEHWTELRGPGFDPHKWHCVVSLSKTHYLPTALVKTQEALAPSQHD